MTVLTIPMVGTACNEPVGPDDAASITLSETAFGMFATETRTLEATVFDHAGSTIDVDVTWESSDPGVVTVDEDGVLVAVSLGTATITARAGAVNDEATIVVVAPLGLTFPILGTLNTDFFYINYVDLRPDEGIEDFACGPKTYDGHRGIDIALPGFVDMDQGVTVVAAAPGTVTVVHDGDFDRQKRRNPGGFGNHVIITHRDEFHTVYGHLRSGSVAVSVGQSVPAGTVLGLVGSSGNSDHPHLHLELQRGNEALEPFSGACGPSVTQWTEPDPYQESFAVITSGLTGLDPTLDLLKDPPPLVNTFRTDDPHVVLWVELYNVRPGMTSGWELYNPSGGLQFSFTLPHRDFFSLSWWYGLFSIPNALPTTGTWRIDYRVNGLVRATRTFNLVQAPGPASRAGGGATPVLPGRTGGWGLNQTMGRRP